MQADILKQWVWLCRGFDPAEGEDPESLAGRWPVCWLLLRPIYRVGLHIPQTQRELVVPIQIDSTLPDYIAKADAYDKGVLNTWRPGDRFRMYFGGKGKGGETRMTCV